MLRNFAVAVFLLGFCFNSFGWGKNDYMDPESEEFAEVTVKLQGDWGIESYFRKSPGEMIGTTYISGKLSLKPIKKKKDPGEAVFVFTVSKDAIQGRIDSWNAKEKVLEVEEYKIITTAKWSVGDDGEIIYFKNPVSNVEVKGSGEHLENFEEFENGLFESSSQMKNEGGLGALIGSKVMDKSSGTDKFMPKVPSQAAITINGEDSVKLQYLKRTIIKLKK